MDWSDLGSLVLDNPARLTLVALLAVAIVLGAALLGRRHPARSRFAAAALRLGALLAVGLALASPSIEAVAESRFEPAGTWRLILDQAEVPPRKADVTDYREPPDRFVDRVRASLEVGKPPAHTEVHGPTDTARRVQAQLALLGLPCRVSSSEPMAAPVRQVLRRFVAPRMLASGEPFGGHLEVAGTGSAQVRFSVDGGPPVDAKVPAGGRVPLPLLQPGPGRHVLVAELIGPAGKVVQKIGHVFRVGEPAVILAVGLKDRPFRRLQVAAANFTVRAAALRDFSASRLQEVDLVLMPVGIGAQLSVRQASDLSVFVANGGGLYVTGDGAAQVAPSLLSAEFRRLLPVRLLEQGEDEPEDPPVKEEIGKAEIATISVCFVLDRSRSMDLQIGGTPGMTRWQVAVKGVVESLKKMDPFANASVMTFTLKTHWVYRPQHFVKFNRQLLEKQLLTLKSDLEFDASGFNTDIYRAVEQAIEELKKERAAVKVIVMMTDGADRPANTGAISGLNHRDLAERAVAAKINIFAAGIGDGFSGENTDARAARKVIEELATRPEFKHIPFGRQDAKRARRVFIDAVEFAYRAYDDEMQRREEERRRLKEEKLAEPDGAPELEVMAGSFPLRMMPVGEQIFGQRALPDPAPKLAWYAKHELREESAIALAIETAEGDALAALALGTLGLGRVAFWSAGDDPESLGEVSGWAEYPRLLSQTLRWLSPRQEREPRLVGRATRKGIRLADPIAEADYFLRSGGTEFPLRLDRDLLRPATDGEGGEGGEAPDLPLGAGEVIERAGSAERVIGDIFITRAAAKGSLQSALPAPYDLPALEGREPEIVATRREATLPLLLLMTLMLLVMAFERTIRRRT